MFLTVFLTARHLCLSQAKWAQSPPFHLVCLRSVSLLHYCLYLRLPISFFPLGVPINTSRAFLFSPIGVPPLSFRWFHNPNSILCRSEWPRGLRRRSAAARLLRLWVRIPSGAWVFICCECWVLSEASATTWSLVQRTVVRRCLWSRNLVNDEALAHWRLSRQKQTTEYSEECFWQWFQTSYYFSLICKCLSQCAYPARHSFVFWCDRPSFKFIEFNM